MFVKQTRFLSHMSLDHTVKSFTGLGCGVGLMMSMLGHDHGTAGESSYYGKRVDMSLHCFLLPCHLRSCAMEPVDVSWLVFAHSNCVKHPGKRMSYANALLQS